MWIDLALKIGGPLLGLAGIIWATISRGKDAEIQLKIAEAEKSSAALVDKLKLETEQKLSDTRKLMFERTDRIRDDFSGLHDKFGRLEERDKTRKEDIDEIKGALQSFMHNMDSKFDNWKTDIIRAVKGAL